MVDISQVPSGLPVPDDDGGADHLTGLKMPKVSLPATDGASRDLSSLGALAVLYIYPMTGRPDVALPDGWNEIPGARGCTPQSCAFRDHFAELNALGVTALYGISTQSTDYQREAKERLHLAFELLSDSSEHLRQALNLPTMIVDGKTLLKRMALIVRGSTIEKVFYPVFPPDQNAADVLAYLGATRA